jgi:DNA-binding protein HU-beta
VSLNRTELVQAVAGKAGLSAADADKALRAFQDVLVEQLAAGETVTIPGFLAVGRADRAARTGVNPQTGEKLEIPAGYRVKVTAGSTLKRAVQGGEPRRPGSSVWPRNRAFDAPATRSRWSAQSSDRARWTRTRGRSHQQKRSTASAIAPTT